MLVSGEARKPDLCMCVHHALTFRESLWHCVGSRGEDKFKVMHLVSYLASRACFGSGAKTWRSRQSIGLCSYFNMTAPLVLVSCPRLPQSMWLHNRILLLHIFLTLYIMRWYCQEMLLFLNCSWIDLFFFWNLIMDSFSTIKKKGCEHNFLNFNIFPVKILSGFLRNHWGLLLPVKTRI